MKNYLYIPFICAFLFLSEFLWAQTPDWTVNPAAYQYSMTITAALNINYTESQDGNDMVAAFVDGQCRGVAKPIYIEAVGRWIAYLVVYSNSTSETVGFKLYDNSTNSVSNVSNTKLFTVNSQIGSSVAPYLISSPTLSNEAFLLSFSIPEQLSSNINGTEISVEMPYGSDLSALVATYTASDYALVKIENTVQSSGTSVNNFTNPLTYVVLSADESQTSSYIVTAFYGNAIPSDIYLSETSIAETTAINSEIATISALDPNIGQTQTYSLVDGDGSADNHLFSISGDKLISETTFNYEEKSSFNIRIKTDDNNGGTFEKAFTIQILYVEKLKLSANKIISPNGDGYLDNWEIEQAQVYKNCIFQIFNTSGEIIFEQTGYDTPWDGTYKGKQLPIGAYYYIIKTTVGEYMKGSITLIK